MKKLTYEKWESKFYDVPFIKENFKLLESMGVGVETVLWSQEVEPTKHIRVFHYGGWYEILDNERHYFVNAYLEGDQDYIGKDEEKIKHYKKELFNWCIDVGVIDIEEVDKKELTSFGELKQ